MKLKPTGRMKNLFVFLFVMAASPLFAQADLMPPGMKSLADGIKGIFIGPFVKTILIICLCGTAVAYGFNKDNEKMKRNCIAIGIAIGVLIGASTIVDTIWGAAGG